MSPVLITYSSYERIELSSNDNFVLFSAYCRSRVGCNAIKRLQWMSVFNGFVGAFIFTYVFWLDKWNVFLIGGAACIAVSDVISVAADHQKKKC